MPTRVTTKTKYLLTANPLSAAGASIEETIKNLGGDPQNPFSVFPEVAELYAKRAKELEAIVAERYAAKDAWAKANPELAEKMKFWFSGKAPKLDWEAIEQKSKPGNPCRIRYRIRRTGYKG